MAVVCLCWNGKNSMSTLQCTRRQRTHCPVERRPNLLQHSTATQRSSHLYIPALPLLNVHLHSTTSATNDAHHHHKIPLPPLLTLYAVLKTSQEGTQVHGSESNLIKASWVSITGRKAADNAGTTSANCPTNWTTVQQKRHTSALQWHAQVK